MMLHYVVVKWSDAHIKILSPPRGCRGDSRRRVRHAWLVSSEQRGMIWKETGDVL